MTNQVDLSRTPVVERHVARSWLTPEVCSRQMFLSCNSPEGCMVTRPRFCALALLAVLVSTPHAQTQKPEILWQFEAGG
jgi:hypothetical protein